MTREDIEQMRKVAPDVVERLERGETIKASNCLKIFHQFQQLSKDDQLKLANMIADYLEKQHYGQQA